MLTKAQRWAVTLGAVAGLWAGASEPLCAQSPTPIPVQVVPLDSSVFRDILDDEPYSMPVLVRHRQDPNVLRPNDAMQTAPAPTTPGSQVARNLLGLPQRSEMLARRGRLRTIAMSQNRAAPMIGDFFGGGNTSLTLTPTIGEAVPFANSPSTGSNFNGFVQLDGTNTPVGPFFARTGYPQLTSFGVDTNNDNLQDTYTSLHQFRFSGGNANPPTVENEGPFQAVLEPGKTIVFAGNTLPVVAVQQSIKLDNIPNPGTGGIVGVNKLAENTSPMPRDRVFFNYSYFNNVPLTANGINLNRFTPGFEKTFNDGTASIEVRAPFATTLNSNITANGIIDGEKTEFGNLSLVYKSLLYRDDDLAFSGGMQIALPTADPINLTLTDGTPIVKIKNQSVHLMPFLGALYTPNDRLFTQAFLQLDVAANGNDVLTNLDLTRLRQLGSVQDKTFLYLDWNMGYWSYLAEDESSFVTGIAPMVELHFNQSLQNTDVLRGPNDFQLGTFGRNYSVLNAVVGTTVQFGPQSALTMGYAFPVGSGVDQQFNGEFRLFFNRRFGPQTRQTRAI